MKKTIQTIIAILIALIGTIVMYGWYAQEASLIQIGPQLAPMQFNTALSFLLCGIAIFFVNRRGKLSSAAAIFIFLISALTLYEYIEGSNTGLDQFFLTHALSIKKSEPGRMAPNTALCFLFISVSIFLNDFFNRKTIADQVIIFSIMSLLLLGILGCAGYLFNLPVLSQWGYLTGMALHTALSFVLIGFALLPLAQDRIKAFKSIDEYMVCLSVAVIGFVSFLISWQVLVSYNDNHIKNLTIKKSIQLQNKFIDTGSLSNNNEDTLKNFSITLKKQNKIFFQNDVMIYPNFRHEWIIEKVFSYHGKEWKITIYPSKDFVEKNLSDIPLIILIFGFLITTLLVIMVRLWQLSEKKNKLVYAAQKKFITVIENSNQAMFIVNELGEITLANHQALQLFEYDKCEFENTTLENLMPKHFQKTLNDAKKNASLQWVSLPSELEIQTKSHRKIPVQVGLTPVEIEQKISLICTIIDISERKQYEQKLIEQRKNIQLMYDSTTLSANSHNTKEAMEKCLNLICRSIEWPIGHVYITDEKNQEKLISSHIWHIEDPERAAVFKEYSEAFQFEKGIGLPGETWEAKKPIWIHNVYESPNFPRAKQEKDIGIRGAVAFPVFVNDTIMAVFEFFSYTTQERDEALIETLEVISEQIGHVFERKLSRMKFEFMALHDALTGAPNRKLFEILANKSFAASKRANKKTAILMFDIDFFKNINDTFGHEIGDALLILASERITNNIRESDTLSRLGGDEFVLINEVKSAEDADNAARKLLEIIKKPFFIKEHEIQISVSIGIALFPDSATTLIDLMRIADNALYYVKKTSRNDFYRDITEKMNDLS